MFETLPNRLTALRVALVPVLIALFFVPGDAASWAALAVFAAAAVTDYLDGRVARMRDEVSTFGRFLDPVADKILVLAALMMLAAFDRLSELGAVAAVIILCREFLISGLREFLGGRAVAVPVSKLAKWKTAVQMVAIGFLLAGPAAPIPAAAIGEGLLWVAAILSAVTAWAYLRAALPHLEGADGGPGAQTAPAEDSWSEDATAEPQER